MYGMNEPVNTLTGSDRNGYDDVKKYNNAINELQLTDRCIV
jgi:hypothetical protein